MINSVSEGGGKKKRRGETEHLTAWKFIRQDESGGVRRQGGSAGRRLPAEGGKKDELDLHRTASPVEKWTSFVDHLGQASCYVS